MEYGETVSVTIEAYRRILKAADSGHGVRLSNEECFGMSMDDSITTAVQAADERNDKASESLPEKLEEGWGWPGLAGKPHYFRDSRSLCGKWGFWGELSQDDGHHGKSDCTPCCKKLAKENADGA